MELNGEAIVGEVRGDAGGYSWQASWCSLLWASGLTQFQQLGKLTVRKLVLALKRY